jgi:Zn ribbon nucleic-acid-binding protein
MRDYANEHLEFIKNFGTEKQCRDYLFALRWPAGFRCPECQHDEMWELNDIKYKCRKCRHQTSLYSGTIFQGTQYKLLPRWFQSIWYVSEGGDEATEMQKYFHIGSRHTALKWLRDLRSIMQNSDEYKEKGSITFRELLQNAIDTPP